MLTEQCFVIIDMLMLVTYFSQKLLLTKREILNRSPLCGWPRKVNLSHQKPRLRLMVARSLFLSGPRFTVPVRLLLPLLALAGVVSQRLLFVVSGSSSSFLSICLVSSSLRSDTLLFWLFLFIISCEDIFRYTMSCLLHYRLTQCMCECVSVSCRSWETTYRHCFSPSDEFQGWNPAPQAWRQTVLSVESSY